MKKDKLMKTNQAGIDLVKHFEAGHDIEKYLTAYLDEIASPPIWTIGYGHTGLTHSDGTVHEGRSVTVAESENLLRHDLGKFEKRVHGFVNVPLNENQFAALVSFDFNSGGLGRSTLLKKLNAGDYAGASQEFKRWNKASGKVINGLTRRRAAEANLFLKPIAIYSVHIPEPKPLRKSRTLAGVALTAPEVAFDAVQKISPEKAEGILNLLPEWARVAAIVLAVAGVLLVTYARISDKNKVELKNE